MASTLAAVSAKLATSSYLTQQLGEYGVTGSTVLPALVIEGPLPATSSDEDIRAWLDTQNTAGTLPARDASTVFVTVFPSTVQVTTGITGGYPFSLCGTDSEVGWLADGSYVALGLGASCGPPAGGQAGIDAATGLFGAATLNAVAQALLSDTPSWWYWLSWSGSAWAGVPGGSSPASLCQGASTGGTYTPADLGFAVPRYWSNAAAAAGHDPCALGAPASTYFNAAPRVRGGTLIQPYVFSKGLIVTPGESVSVPVELFSDGPTPAWKLQALEHDIAGTSGSPTPALVLTWDRHHGRNGDVRELTIHRKADAASTAAGPRQIEIRSTLGTTTHSWFINVGLD